VNCAKGFDLSLLLNLVGPNKFGLREVIEKPVAVGLSPM